MISRWLLSQSGGLGTGSDFGNATDDRGAGASHRESPTRTWPGASLHRGLQYASEEYIKVLENNRVIPSMSRPANPYDNASCESFMKTLKREEIYANKYDDLENLRANIEEFIEQYYNRLRLHSSLGYRSPEEFEQQIETSGSAESRSATMVFFENKQNSRKISKGLLGKGTQMPSPSPDPFSC